MFLYLLFMETKIYRIDATTCLLIDREDLLQTYKKCNVVLSINHDPPIFQTISNKYAFNIICGGGDIEVAACLLEIWPEINYITELTYGFKIACRYGHLDFAKWLYAKYPEINIRDKKDYAFRFACYYGHIDVAKWIYNMYPTIDITEQHDCDMTIICNNNRIDVAKWFCELMPNRYIITIIETSNQIALQINK